MRRISAIVAFAIGLVVATAFGQGADPRAKPLLVGVVDLSAVFKSYKRKDALEKDILAQKEQIDAKAGELRASVDEAQKALQRLMPDSPKFADQKHELRKRSDEFSAFREEADEKLKAAIESMTTQVLDDVDQAVSDLGKKKGYDLILKTDNAGMSDLPFQERIMRGQVQGVLYRDDALDLTGKLIDALNDPSFRPRPRPPR